MNRTVLLGATLAISTVAAMPANAATSLVVNGSFEANAAHGVEGIGGDGSTYITGWTLHSNGGSIPLAWYYPAGTADTNTVTAKIYGPGNGTANGFGLSPDGGAMVALDGSTTYQASLSQTITGLTPGTKYNVSFYWAGAQQFGFSGPTTEQYQVSLGNQTISTSVWHDPSHGFSGWFHETFTYTPTSSSEVLTFLAVGTPAGQPPFSLLDGISLYAAPVPEPASWAMMLGGLGTVGFALRRRRNGAAVTA